MSETVVRVDLRQATLSESARLRETGAQAFLCLENPPPVRSLLRITSGDEQRAFEVGRVIEVVDDSEAERGCHGTFIALERMAEQLRVGSEHLQPGVNSSGVPSPVVIMNTNEMLLLAESGSDEEESLAAGRERVDEQEAPSEKLEADSPEADKPDSDSPEADKLEADSPEADKPDSDSPEADKPETDKPEANSDSPDSDAKSSPVGEDNTKYD